MTKYFFIAASEKFLTLEEPLDEILKEDQVDWEADIPLNMGQWLSIPMIILGITIFIKTFPSRNK